MDCHSIDRLIDSERLAVGSNARVGTSPPCETPEIAAHDIRRDVRNAFVAKNGHALTQIAADFRAKLVGTA